MRATAAAQRIIPAGAGNSSSLPVGRGCGRDHPRRRGELQIMKPLHEHKPGSSPQARGTHNTDTGTARYNGIIPAGAGNSMSDSEIGPASGDHPRRRGELTASVSCPARLLGSSPQARGTLSTAARSPHQAGIIPAGAGNSHSPGSSRSGSWDHPRRRGELLVNVCGVDRGKGSSPQARGTHQDRLGSGRVGGIIPAGAGNSKRPWFDTR